MAKKKIDDVDLLLSKLDKIQLADFIRKECTNDGHLKDRFLALGAGTLFKPDPNTYALRVEDLIEDFGGRHGYIEYRDTFDFNHSVTRILDEANEAMDKGQWEVTVAVLTGIASVSEDILNSGDDSAGELGAMVSDCFEKWHELCSMKFMDFPLTVFRMTYQNDIIRFQPSFEGRERYSQHTRKSSLSNFRVHSNCIQ